MTAPSDKGRAEILADAKAVLDAFRPPKRVKLKLVGLDGNAFSILGAFQQQARREKWTSEEIKTVMDRAMSGDYNHLLATIVEHTR